MALAYLMDGIQTVLFVKKVLQNLNSHNPITLLVKRIIGMDC